MLPSTFATMHVPAMASVRHHPIPSGGTPGLGDAAEEHAARVFALMCDEFAWVPNTPVPSPFTYLKRMLLHSGYIDPMPHCVVLRKPQN
jgi:hypothetical protein